MTVGERLIGIGTTRAPKIHAVERALRELRQRFPEFLSGDIRLEPRNSPSGVSETPRSREETMRGARHRASSVYDELCSEGKIPALAVGLEGGVAHDESAPLLEAWAYATDGSRGYFGGSGSIPLPHGLSELVLVEGLELRLAADRYFGRLGVADKEGTFGVLTRMMVSREEAFARSLIHALAPFYNEVGYELGNKG